MTIKIILYGPGAESPQAVQKLMSLVETSRVRPAKPVTVGNVSPLGSPVGSRRNTTGKTFLFLTTPHWK